MSAMFPDMIDAVFDLSGESVPEDYPFGLWDELQRLFPGLADEPSVGILPLRTAKSVDGMLLARRAKLVLRLPRVLSENIMELSGQVLDVDRHPLQIGQGKLREIQPYPTISSHRVCGERDEVLFMEKIAATLAEMNIPASLICGRANVLEGAKQSIHGFSLVIHNLKPEDSLRLQYTGLGGNRQHGCGIFIPYKVISDLT